MKDHLREIVGKVGDNNLARCLVREYLQARTLESLQSGGAFETWAFVGGTSLRFLYGMPRFSEDLDFSLTEAGRDDRFAPLMTKVKNVFLAEGYAVSVSMHTAKTVRSAFVRFEGLLYEVDLSPRRSETVSIKVEIDTNPPQGAVFETSLVRRHCLLNLLHYDKASLLAGKLHALLSRRYLKGRDVYDLVWYLSDRSWPPPNMSLLNNALQQTSREIIPLSAANWRQEIAARLAQCDWGKVIADVSPFLESHRDLSMLERDAVLKLLQPG
jgi:predicted nucleotidyltransferase component of viral defense system